MELEKFWRQLAPFLSPLGLLYGKFMLIRRKAYRRGLFAAYRPRAFVISVGNITLGGEGKTPLVLWLASFLKARGIRAAILTRGYKGRFKGPAIASRGEGPLFGPDAIGDEAYLLALKSRSPVMVARDRVQGAFWAIKEFEAEVLILDDGFQHLRLERDLDLLLFSALRDPFKEKVFPAGRLREPLSVLKGASAFILTKTNLARDEGKRLFKRLTPFEKPVFKIPYLNQGPYPLGKEQTKPLPRRVFAFAGLGDNTSFYESLKGLNISPVGFRALPDHVSYTPTLIRSLLDEAQRLGAEALLTTEKDAVKLLTFKDELKSCYVLPLEASPGRDFEEFVLQKIRLCTGF